MILSKRSRRILDRGFTLIELMIVVAIIGILAAVAVPSFMKYIKKAKTTEARLHLEKIYNGARTYYYETTEIGRGPVIAALASQFPDATVITPPTTCCFTGAPRCEPDALMWDTDDTWAALKFSLGDPHYYQYDYKNVVPAGVPGAAEGFTAFAFGDLDCDGVLSEFTMFGFITTVGGEPTLNAGQTRRNDLE